MTTSSRRHNAKGRSTGKLTPAAEKYLKAEPPFVWISGELLNSPVWRALGLNSMRLINRIMLEHCQHGGIDNGKLPVTHADFEAYGLTRNFVAAAVQETEFLGLVRCKRGGRFGDAKKASIYRLTWIGTVEAPATNEWKGVTIGMIENWQMQQRQLRLAKRQKRQNGAGEKQFAPPKVRVLDPLPRE